MNPPRLEACYFEAAPSTFGRMARVLEATARRHCPGWRVNVRSIVPPRRVSALGIPSHAHNTQKLEEWARLIAEALDGERVLLIDADTAILRPLDDVWAMDFDLAYTVRPEGSTFPFNGGVVFVRVNARTRQFMERWRALNAEFLATNDGTHRAWRVKFGGINQASFGSLLEAGAGAELSIQPLPCAEWNCEDETWHAHDTDVTRILHIKGALRRTLFLKGQGPTPRAVERMANLWRDLEAELALGAVAR